MKIETGFLWQLALIFVTLAVLYFIGIFFFKKRSMVAFMKRKSKRAQLAPIISNFLFHSQKDPKDQQKEYVELKITIREYLNDRYFRHILAEILFDLQKDVAGATRDRLFNLFTQLELHHDSFQKLRSWRWNKVAQGILELAQMEVPDAFQFISKYINDRRGVVRKQAEIAIVSLQKDGLAYLLDNTKYAISEWQQIKLIEALGTIKDYVPPKFKTWLLSNNTDVVLFTLRLIKHFNQNEAAPSIAELVKHKNDNIKIAAISCIQDFNFYQALELLKNVFWKCNTEVKIQILETARLLGKASELPFLNEVAKEESNFSVTSKALAAINSIAPDSVLPTKDIIEDLDTPIVRSKAGLEDSSFLDMEVSCEELMPEKKSSKENIDVEEVEVYEFVELPSNDTIEIKPNTDEVSIDELKIDEHIIDDDVVDDVVFDFEELAVEDDNSLNFSLGLLSAAEADAESTDLSQIKETYITLTSKERAKFVDTLELGGDIREIELLEFIMEFEEESELRFRAFNVLKKLAVVAEEPDLNSHQQDLENVTTDLDFSEEKPKVLDKEKTVNGTYRPEDSIFYSLYHHASDLDSKIILVKQAIAVSDEKDIPFFRFLLKNEENTIARIAQKAIDQIKIPEEPCIAFSSNLEALETPVLTGNNELDTAMASTILLESTEELTKIPLELCFLYDELGIMHAEHDTKEDLGLNFDLSDEFFRTRVTETLNQEL